MNRLYFSKKNQKKNDESLDEEDSVRTGPSRCTGMRGGRQLSEVGYSEVDESPLDRNLLVLTSGSKS